MVCVKLRIAGENCSIFNCHSIMAAPVISNFRIPTKNDDYSTNWRNNIAAVKKKLNLKALRQPYEKSLAKNNTLSF